MSVGVVVHAAALPLSSRNNPKTMTAPATPTPRFDTFYRYEALTRLLFDYARRTPRPRHRLVDRQELRGPRHLGRGGHEQRHRPRHRQARVLGRRQHPRGRAHCEHRGPVLPAPPGHGARQRPSNQHLLATRTVYLCPRLNPDGAELALADRPRHIRSSTRRYPFEEDPVDGLRVEDVDGDGRVLFMRVPDPHGGYKKCEQDPRLMVARRPGEFGGEYYRLMPEGTLINYDGLTINVNKDPEGLDLNRNFPAAWRQEFEQVGAGAYPASEPEVKAMIDFVLAHPEHRRGGQLPHAQRRDPAPDGHAERRRHDRRRPLVDQTLQRAGRRAHRLPRPSHLARLQIPPERTIGGTQDWLYEHLGALFWVVELCRRTASRHHRLQVDRLVPASIRSKTT